MTAATESVVSSMQSPINEARKDDEVTPVTQIKDPEVEQAFDELNTPSQETGYPSLPVVASIGPSDNKSFKLRNKRKKRNTTSLKTIPNDKMNNGENGVDDCIDFSLSKTLALKNQNIKAKDYLSLSKTLTTGLENDRQKVVSILAWICRHDIPNRKDVKGDPGTPMAYMKLIQEGSGTYSAYLASICRFRKCPWIFVISNSSYFDSVVHLLLSNTCLRLAGIPTIIVKGYCKTSSTEVGESSDDALRKQTSSWNLVYTDKKWRIVHPFMVCNAVDNMGVASEIDSILQRPFHESYIFPDSKVFASRFTPEESFKKWQLHVNYNFDQWKRIPLLYPAFRKYRFDFFQNYGENVTITTDNGVIPLSFVVPQKVLDDLEVSFKLIAKESGSDDTTENCVFMTTSNSQVSFEIRFQNIGLYTFIVFATDSLNPSLPITAYRLECRNLQNENKPSVLPINTGTVGWGYSSLAEKSGLYLPSHLNGKIVTKKEEILFMQFQVMTDDVFTVVVQHTTLNEEELQQWYSWNMKKEKNSARTEFNICVHIPISGEFSLSIGIDKNGESAFVCHYLIVVLDRYAVDASFTRQTPQQNKAIQILREAMVSSDVNDLQSSLTYARKHRISDEVEDVKRIQKRIIFLEQKKELNDTLQRQRLDVAFRTLSRLSKSEFSMILTPEFQMVKDMIDHLKSRHGKALTEDDECNIVSLSEICNMKMPRQEIIDTMEAICIIIGHRRSDLVDWDEIRVKLMIDKRKTLKLMARVERDTTEASMVVETSTSDCIEELLKDLDENKIAQVGQSVLPYYKWVKTQHLKMKENAQENQPRLDINMNNNQATAGVASSTEKK